MPVLVVLVAACSPILESRSSLSDPLPPDGAIDLRHRGWTQMELDFADPQHLTGLRVRGGTLDGRTTLDTQHRFPRLGGGGALLRANPFHSEIRRAHVVYGFFDGQDSELILVSLETGATTLVETTRDVIHSAALGHDGSVYYLTLDAETREERGIFRRRPDQPPVLVLEPRAVKPVPIDGSTLHVTPDGEFLLVHDCAFESCVLRVYVAETGEYVREYQTFARGLLGVFNEQVVAGGECVEAPCRAVRLALRGDEATPFGTVCDRTRAIDLRGEVAVVTSKRPDCVGDARDLVVNPVTGGSLPIGVQEFAGMDLVGVGVEPAGSSIVVATDGQLFGGTTGRVVDVATGESRPFELE